MCAVWWSGITEKNTSGRCCATNHTTHILTLNVQKHALLMTSDPAECLAVEAAEVGEPHAADCQHRLAVTAADFKAAVLPLETQTHPRVAYFCRRDDIFYCSRPQTTVLLSRYFPTVKFICVYIPEIFTELLPLDKWHCMGILSNIQATKRS